MRRTPLLAAWGATALLAALAAATGFGGPLDRGLYDLRSRLAERTYEGPVVLVAIDQASLRELAGWPWPRSRHAQLVERLTAAGASVIGFDIDFSSPSDPAEDAAFAAAIRASQRVVLAAFKEVRTLESGLSLEYASLPLPALAEGAAAVGSILVPVDPDGAVRRTPLRDTINGEPIWAFGFEVARLYTGLARERLAGLAPADGVLRLDYTAGRPPVVPYADVLAGRVPKELFAGRIVLVGATALELQDLRATPLGRLTPGVQVQGHVADTLLRGGGPRPVGEWPAAFAAVALALPALAAARGRRRALGLALAALPAPLGLLALFGAARAGLLLPAAPFVLAGLAGTVAHALAEWTELRRELARTRTRLRTLAEFGRRADPTRGLEQSVETVLEVVRELLGLQTLAVELADGRLIRPPSVDGAAAGASSAAGDLPGAAQHARGRRPVRRSAAVSRRRPGRPDADAGPAAAADGAPLEVPLVGAEGVRGRLLATMPPGRAVGPDERALLEAIAARVAVDTENRSLAADLRSLHLSVIHSLAVAIEMRNAYTGQHCEGVARRAAELAEAFGLDPEAVEKVRIGGLLHDIGKIGVPESILLKPGRFTPEEYEVMKQHAAIGHKIIASLPFAEEVKDYVRHHHERYDGSGYPDGLAGEALSLGARIVAVADCYEAFTTDRPYRPRVTAREAMAYLRAHAGTHYDPRVVAKLEAVLRAQGVDIGDPPGP